MLDKTWRALENLSSTFSKEMRSVFGKSANISATMEGDLTVMVSDGNVMINGPMRELRINGKLVRFKP